MSSRHKSERDPHLGQSQFASACYFMGLDDQ